MEPVRIAVLAIALLMAQPATTRATWVRILDEDFSTATGWTFNGVQNGSSQDLIRHHAGSQNVDAEWDQSNNYNAATNPDTIESSSYLKALPMTLTQNDTFRAGTTLRLSAIAGTTEFYQIANFGLYNSPLSGPDRAVGDPLVMDVSDAVEWNYFINSTFGGHNIAALMAAHIAGLDHLYTSGSDFTQTIMGTGNTLPLNTDLYLELKYDGTQRKAFANIYTNAARTAFLFVNGKEMSYETDALPAGRTFSVAEVGFQNWATPNFGGANGTGQGTYDDVFVDVIPEPSTFFFMGTGFVCFFYRFIILLE